MVVYSQKVKGLKQTTAEGFATPTNFIKKSWRGNTFDAALCWSIFLPFCVFREILVGPWYVKSEARPPSVALSAGAQAVPKEANLGFTPMSLATSAGFRPTCISKPESGKPVKLKSWVMRQLSPWAWTSSSLLLYVQFPRLDAEHYRIRGYQLCGLLLGIINHPAPNVQTPCCRLKNGRLEFDCSLLSARKAINAGRVAACTVSRSLTFVLRAKYISATGISLVSFLRRPWKGRFSLQWTEPRKLEFN